jgi:hypothetical protein
MTFLGFLREEYPPFTFAATPDDPGDDPRVRVDIVPQIAGRNRLTGFPASVRDRRRPLVDPPPGVHAAADRRVPAVRLR